MSFLEVGISSAIELQQIQVSGAYSFPTWHAWAWRMSSMTRQKVYQLMLGAADARVNWSFDMIWSQFDRKTVWFLMWTLPFLNGARWYKQLARSNLPSTAQQAHSLLDNNWRSWFDMASLGQANPDWERILLESCLSRPISPELWRRWATKSNGHLCPMHSEWNFGQRNDAKDQRMPAKYRAVFWVRFCMLLEVCALLLRSASNHRKGLNHPAILRPWYLPKRYVFEAAKLYVVAVPFRDTGKKL